MDPQHLNLIYKISMVVVAIIGLFIPIIVAIVGVIFVRKSQRRKEDAEAKYTEIQTKLTETQLNKIQQEAKNVISNVINEPTIKDMTEGYNTLMANFKIQIEQIQTENKRLRYDFDLELKCLREEIKTLKEENEKLRDENNELKRKVNSFIKKTNKKNKQDLGEQKPPQ